MIKYPEVQIKESLLPAKRWKLNDQGRWRQYSSDGEEVKLANYPPCPELPQQLNLPQYTDSDYETMLQGKEKG